MLVAVCGLPAVGKSTIAQLLSNRLDRDVLRSDVVRKQLYDEPTYSHQETIEVYETMAAMAYDHGWENTIIDATFSKQQYRAIMDSVGDVLFVHVKCHPDITRERLRNREDDPSDADVEVYEAMRSEFDLFKRPRIVVWNEKDDPSETAAVAGSKIQARSQA